MQVSMNWKRFKRNNFINQPTFQTQKDKKTAAKVAARKEFRGINTAPCAQGPSFIREIACLGCWNMPFFFVLFSFENFLQKNTHTFDPPPNMPLPPLTGFP